MTAAEKKILDAIKKEVVGLKAAVAKAYNDAKAEYEEANHGKVIGTISTPRQPTQLSNAVVAAAAVASLIVLG